MTRGRIAVSIALVAVMIVSLLLAATGNLTPVMASGANLVQQNSGGAVNLSGDTPITVSYSSNVAAGNTILVGAVTDDNLAPLSTTVSDSLGSSFFEVTSLSEGGGIVIGSGTSTTITGSVFIYAAALASSGGDSVTVNFNSGTLTSASEEDVYVYEVSGVGFVGAVSGSGTGTDAAAASVLPYADGAFLLGILLHNRLQLAGGCDGAIAAPGSGFTASPAPAGSCESFAEYSPSSAFVSPATDFEATLSTSTGWAVAGVALSPVAPTFSTVTSTDTVTSVSTETSISTSTVTEMVQPLATVVGSGAGTITPNCPGPNGCSEVVGTLITVTASPATGSVFKSWKVTGASCTAGDRINPCTFTMPNNPVNVTVTFH